MGFSAMYSLFFKFLFLLIVFIQQLFGSASLVLFQINLLHRGNLCPLFLSFMKAHLYFVELRRLLMWEFIMDF